MNIQRKMFNLLKGRKMSDLSQIWQDIVNYCQKVFDNSKNNQVITEVSKKTNKVVKKKKKSVKN